MSGSRPTSAAACPRSRWSASADKAVREARERVRAAIVNSGYEFPAKRITVNLAPAYLRKVGPGFDLPMAMAILAASGQLAPEALERCAVVGELSLTGGVRATRGTLAIAEGAERQAIRRLLVPLGPRARGRARPVARGAGRGDAAGGGRGGARRSRAGADPGARARPVAPAPADARRPERRPRPQRPRPGARDRRGRRPQPLHARPAGHGQDHDRPAAAVAAAAADAVRGDRDHPRALGGRACTAAAGSSRSARSARRTTRSRPPGSSAAAARPRRGRSTLAHHGVLFLDELSEFNRPGARGAAPAAGGRSGDDRARSARDRVPDPLHARRGVEPLPVRARGARVHLLGGRPRAPPAPPQRPAARPHRRVDHRRAPVGGRHAPAGRAALGGGARPHHRRARAPGRAAARHGPDLQRPAHAARCCASSPHATRRRPAPARSRSTTAAASAPAATAASCASRARSPTSRAATPSAREHIDQAAGLRLDEQALDVAA